jgi:hypothetical protein
MGRWVDGERKGQKVGRKDERAGRLTSENKVFRIQNFPGSKSETGY